MKYNRFCLSIVTTAIIIILAACSATKHVPDGEYLLDRVSVDVTDRNDVSETELYNFLRQTPNHKVLGFAKLQLATYSLSGRDTTRWYNRWLRRVGQAPVIYDPDLTSFNLSLSTAAISMRAWWPIPCGTTGASVSMCATA